MSTWLVQDLRHLDVTLSPVAAVIADLRRLADHLEVWHHYCEPENTLAFHDAVHAIQRAIVAAQELDAGVDRPTTAEQWIG